MELSVVSTSSDSVLASNPTHRVKHSHLPARNISWYIVSVLECNSYHAFWVEESFGLAFAEYYIGNASACSAVAVFTRLRVGCENLISIAPILSS